MMSSREILGIRVGFVLILFFVTTSNSQDAYSPYNNGPGDVLNDAPDPDPYSRAGQSSNGGVGVPAAPYNAGNQGIGQGQGSSGGGVPAAPYDAGNQGTGQGGGVPAAPYDAGNQGTGQGASDPDPYSRAGQTSNGGGVPAAPYDAGNQGTGQGASDPDPYSRAGQTSNGGGVPAAPYNAGNQGIGQSQGSSGGGVPAAPYNSGNQETGQSQGPSGGGIPAPPYGGSNQGIGQALSEWSVWARWQMCSVTCGEGVKLRERRCGAPGSGAQCIGQNVESGKCQETPVCQDGTFIQELHIRPYQTAVLNCYGKRYMRKHPAASVVWYRNDEPVPLRGSLTEGSTFNQIRKILTANKYIVHTADLKMTNVLTVDEGIYACAIFLPEDDMPTYSTVILLKVNQTGSLLDAGHLQLAKLLWPICFPILLLLTAACSMKVEVKRYKAKGMPPEVVEEIKQRKLENKRKKEEAKAEAKLQKVAAKQNKKAKTTTAAAPPPPIDTGGGGPPPPPAPSTPAPPPPAQAGAAPPPPPPGPAAPGPPPPPAGPPMMAPGPPAPAAPQHEMVPGPMALMMQQAPPTFGNMPGPPPPGPPMAPPAGPPMAPPPGPSGPPPPAPGGGGGGPPPPPPPPPR